MRGGLFRADRLAWDWEAGGSLSAFLPQLGPLWLCNQRFLPRRYEPRSLTSKITVSGADWPTHKQNCLLVWIQLSMWLLTVYKLLCLALKGLQEWHTSSFLQNAYHLERKIKYLHRWVCRRWGQASWNSQPNLATWPWADHLTFLSLSAYDTDEIHTHLD